MSRRRYVGKGTRPAAGGGSCMLTLMLLPYLFAVKLLNTVKIESCAVATLITLVAYGALTYGAVEVLT